MGLKAVAKAAGVSHTTVSNAFNRPDHVSRPVRERVLRIAAEMGYAGPDPAGRTLKTGRADAIAVTLAERLAYAFGDPAAVRFLQGVADATADHPLSLMLVPSPPDARHAASAARRAAVDGFVVYSTSADDAAYLAASERRLPMVVVDSPRTLDTDFVGIDDRAAGEAALDHLLELGHQHFGIITLGLTASVRHGSADLARRQAATATWPRARLEGSERAVTRAGLDWSRVNVEERRTSTVEDGRAAAHALLTRAPQTTAIFAFSDLLAIGARGAAEERGLTVPHDLSVVGFDDTAPGSEALTTVRQPHYEKGRRAAERLLELLRGGGGRPQYQLLPTELVVRGSTAAPRLAGSR